MLAHKWLNPWLLTGFCLTATGEAGIYKWTDEKGQVHFGDRPGAHQSEQVQVRPGPASSAPATGQAERNQLRQRMLDVYREERAEKQAAALKERQQRAERKERCRLARGRYDDYSQAGGIYNYTEDGGRDYLDKQARARFMARLQAEVRQWCGK